MTDDKTEFVSTAYSCDNVRRGNITSLFAVHSSLICTLCINTYSFLIYRIGETRNYNVRRKQSMNLLTI